LSIVLFGRSELSFRVFDACWQLLVLGTLLSLAVRDGRQWHVGWLAVTLYVLAYYGLGYTDTGEREGFAVLPMLLAAHAVTSTEGRGLRGTIVYGFGGVMGFAVFVIKPPLGLCFGVLWLQALAEAWHRRREGWAALTGSAALTAGFVISAAAAVALLMRLGWWSSYWPILVRKEIPAPIVLGPWQILEMMPRVAAAAVLIGLALSFGLLLMPRGIGPGRPGTAWLRGALRSLIVGAVVFALLLTILYWARWRAVFLRVAGLVIPALGAGLVCTWYGRSRVWRTVMLLGCASFGAILLQGNFNTYQFHPVLAAASYLAAHELIHGLRRFHTDPQSARVWTAVCLAGIAHLGTCHWWRKMTACTTAPYVLAHTTLQDHYANVTRNKTHVASYKTVRRVARRIQALTAENEPIACLFLANRIYLFSQRPPVHGMIYIHDDYRQFHPELMHTIGRRRPKVVLARVTPGLGNTTDLAAIESAVFDKLEEFFGPEARVIRDHYRIAEIIDDVCILQNRES